MKRRPWNIDYAWRYRRMVRHVDRQGIRLQACGLTPQFYLDAQDDVRSEFRYHGLPIGVIARMNRRALERPL